MPVGVRADQACQTGTSCDRVPCFEVRVEARLSGEQLRRQARACGRHLADVVQALQGWASGEDLADGRLIVFAFDPVQQRPGPFDRGFAFSNIPIGPGSHV